MPFTTKELFQDGQATYYGITNKAIRVATGCSYDTAERILILFEDAGYISEKNNRFRHKVYIKNVELTKLI